MMIGTLCTVITFPTFANLWGKTSQTSEPQLKVVRIKLENLTTRAQLLKTKFPGKVNTELVSIYSVQHPPNQT